jgi:hypothetical protein
MTEVFEMVPASAKAMWFFAILCALLIGLTGLFGYLGWSVRHSSFEVSSDALRLRGDLWGRTVPLAALELDRARRVDLSREPEYRPRRRTMGTGLPGYAGGWFRLANGEKALVYLTDRSRAVYLPTGAGYALLLSPADPDGLLEALRRRQRGR